MRKILSVLLAALTLFGMVFTTSCGKTGIYAAAQEFVPNYSNEQKKEGIYEEVDEWGRKTVEEYNKDGYLVKSTVTTKYGDQYCWEYEYTSDGKCAKMVIKYPSEELPEVYVITYNENGSLAEINYENVCLYAEDGEPVYMSKRVFTYDKSGKIISDVFCRADNGEAFLNIEYTYDELKHKITKTESREGKLDCVTDRYYSSTWKQRGLETHDANGKLTAKDEYYENGNLKYQMRLFSWGGSFKTHFDENGKEIESFSLDDEGNETERTTSEYDDAGNLIKKTTYDATGNLIKETTYDANGNVVDSKTYD